MPGRVSVKTGVVPVVIRVVSIKIPDAKVHSTGPTPRA